MSADVDETKRYLKLFTDECMAQLRVLVESQALLIRKLDEIAARSGHPENRSESTEGLGADREL